MQAKLHSYPRPKKVFDYWALNDVGTYYYIIGEAYLGKKEYEKSLEAYRTLLSDYSYAQCWDPQGWFWKPKEEAEYRIGEILSEKKKWHLFFSILHSPIAVREGYLSNNKYKDSLL